MIQNNILNIYLKCENVPILWKKPFNKIANERDNGLKSFNRQCRERHFSIKYL